MNKYQPKFKPEVYLKFLNITLYLARDLSNKVSFRIFQGSTMIEFLGNCIEECLDQAILATSFDKELKKCPTCESSNSRKDGKTIKGTQRLKCKCGRHYQDIYLRNSYGT